MVPRIWLWAGLLLTGFAHAGGWTFSAAVPVTPPAAEGVFHHLESAGRRSIAVSGTVTAVAWEDNSSGDAKVSVALNRPGSGFAAPVVMSGETAAYEPAVVGLSDSRFLVAWEEAGKIWFRMLGERGAGPRVWAGNNGSTHVTLATGADGRTYAAWSRPNGRYYQIVVAEVKAQGLQPNVSPPVPADAQPPQQEQLYPALAVLPKGLVVAWEDRREGHTRLYYTSLQADGSFREPAELNETKPERDAKFGRGTGVTRVALATNGRRVGATWMDKRNFKGGYDVYAAVSSDLGRTFGANEKVQDMFGENIPQWHPSIAIGPDGLMVVAWDDARDEASNVWLSWRMAQGWSDDLGLPGADGQQQRTHPVLAFDAKGALHMAWTSRSPEGATRIWYSVGRYQN